jgi:uncharacterized protein YndB with AHSA1/START domain
LLDMTTTPVDPPASEHLVREVELAAPTDVVWRTLTDPDELASWMGGQVDLDLEPGAAGRVTDDDGTVRQVLVTDVEPGHRLAWHWWSDDGELSSVELVVDPLDDDRSRVRVSERLTPDGFDGFGGFDGRPVSPQASARPLALARA